MPRNDEPHRPRRTWRLGSEYSLGAADNWGGDVRFSLDERHTTRLDRGAAMVIVIRDVLPSDQMLIVACLLQFLAGCVVYLEVSETHCWMATLLRMVLFMRPACTTIVDHNPGRGGDVTESAAAIQKNKRIQRTLAREPQVVHALCLSLGHAHSLRHG